MTSVTSGVELPGHEPASPKPKLDHSFDIRGVLIFLGVMACGLGSFGVAYSERTLIGSLPLVGAMASGVANALFMRYFQKLAVAHFTVRRLERQYDAVTIMRYYTAISAKFAKS